MKGKLIEKNKTIWRLEEEKKVLIAELDLMNDAYTRLKKALSEKYEPRYVIVKEESDVFIKQYPILKVDDCGDGEIRITISE